MSLSTVPSSWISLKVLAALSLLLAASTATFWALVRRWESHRRSLALTEWGREHDFYDVIYDSAHLPEPLGVISTREPQVLLALASERSVLIQFQTRAVQQADGMPGTTGTVTWNLLIRRIELPWKPTGLRPTTAQTSVLDLFSLSSFPLLASTERFTIFGTDSAAARALATSMTRSLMPPDIGLLLHGNQLILDFSDRPFDEIEFNRMLSLAEQISQKLPVPV
jgi:hypothetical protein